MHSLWKRSRIPLSAAALNGEGSKGEVACLILGWISSAPAPRPDSDPEPTLRASELSGTHSMPTSSALLFCDREITKNRQSWRETLPSLAHTALPSMKLCICTNEGEILPDTVTPMHDHALNQSYDASPPFSFPDSDCSLPVPHPRNLGVTPGVITLA